MSRSGAGARGARLGMIGRTRARNRSDPDGSRLLTSMDVGDLLSAAVGHAGGRLESWSLDHVDANPGQSTTATYAAWVTWPHGPSEELLGVSARADGPAESDEDAEIFGDGDRRVAVWLYPRDPDLPGLATAAYPDQLARLLGARGVIPASLPPERVRVEIVGYRPRRRAVLRVLVGTDPPVVLYVKAMRAQQCEQAVTRHELLSGAGVGAPEVALVTDDHLLVLRELPGRALAEAMLDDADPCRAEDLIGLLDSMPAEVARLDRRPPWVSSVELYAEMVARALPSQRARLERLSREIASGVRRRRGDEPTHGDFHEGQVHVADDRVVGMLDVDTIGPGDRVDDLACLVAHMSTVQRTNDRQRARIQALLRSWVPVFDQRVDAAQVRLRAAGVIISLATGPFRSQDDDWEAGTAQMIEAAETLVRQVR